MLIGSELSELVRREDYGNAIELVRQAIDDDIGNLSDPVVKQWLALRFRNLFISAAARDPLALDHAPHYADIHTRLRSGIPIPGHDRRPARQIVAESYLRGPGRDEWRLEMPLARSTSLGGTTLVLVPGVGSGLLPAREFPTVLPRLAEELGWQILRVDVNPLTDCATVGEDIDRTVRQGLGIDAGDNPIDPDSATPPGDLLFIGYSKGTPDVLEYLVANPDIAARTRAVVTWAGAARGSHLAEPTWEQIKDVDLPAVPDGLTRITESFLRLVAPYLSLNERALHRSAEFDLKKAVHALLPEVREQFLNENSDKLHETGVPIFSVTGSTDITRVPASQIRGLLALSDHDRNNDMQVTQYESTLNHLPLATHLARVHANHWDLSFEAWPREYRLTSPNLENEFPKQATLVALVQFLSEFGLVD